MAEITVSAQGDNRFGVTVAEGGTTTSHVVTASPRDVARLGSGASARDLVRASFGFLLDREPKESILGRFDLTVIEGYFPEYSNEIGRYL